MATAGQQWAGYDYPIGLAGKPAGLVQGTKRNRYGRRADAESAPGRFTFRTVSADCPKICKSGHRLPKSRAAFNDRIDALSTELRAVADHRLVELALRQPSEPKSRARRVNRPRLAARLAPTANIEAPKRPLQTPNVSGCAALAQWAES